MKSWRAGRNEDYLVCTQREGGVGGEVIVETIGLATVLPPSQIVGVKHIC